MTYESFVTTYPLIANAITFILKRNCRNLKMLKIECFRFQKNKSKLYLKNQFPKEL